MKELKRVSAFAVALVLLAGLAFPVSARADEVTGTLDVSDAANTLDDSYRPAATTEPDAALGAPLDTEPKVPVHDLSALGSYTIKADAEVWNMAFTGEMQYAVPDDGAAITVEAGVDAVILLDGVTVRAQNGPAILVEPGGTLTIVLAGDSSLYGASGYPAIQAERLDDETIAAVTILTDNGGALYAEGGSGAAGIGAGPSGNSGARNAGAIVIESGDVTAVGGKGGAGIGGGNGNDPYQERGDVRGASGTIVINGGVVDATGNDGGAGIGGGNNGLAESIAINGGNVTARVNGSGAAIGSGSHNNALSISIQGGDVTAVSNDGAAIGSGLGSSKPGDKPATAHKGPGYYYAIVDIGGSAVVDAESGNLAAAIGGGMYCDAAVNISGSAWVNASVRQEAAASKAYQGAAGIGGGYQGYAIVNIMDGEVTATGGNSAPGIGSGAVAQTGKRQQTAAQVNYITEPLVAISGGIVTATGSDGAAGIGSGNGTALCNIEISGGEVTATGGVGGAGIGSGVGGEGYTSAEDNQRKYAVDTALNISITGGLVEAVGGENENALASGETLNHGASAIGSGALNATAKSVAVGVQADVTAVSEGTKFAVDTARGAVERTETDARLLQGTFMDKAELKGLNVTVSAGTAGADGVTPGADVTSVALPGGYRSFAVTVWEDGTYLVSDGDTYYVYNTEKAQRSETELVPDAVASAQYDVSGTLSDNYFLYAPADPLPLVWTVTFDSNGGSQVDAQRVLDGALAASPADPNLDGSTFTGWFTDAALTAAYDFDTAVHQDITLYAGWEKQTVVEPPATEDPGTGESTPPATEDPAPEDPGTGESTPPATEEPGPIEPTHPAPVDPGPGEPTPPNTQPPAPEPAPEPAPTQTPPAQPTPAPVVPEETEEVDITDEETPLSDAADLPQPNPDVQIPPALEEDIIILDEDVPLGDLPQTGTTHNGGSAMGLTLLLGAAMSGLTGLALRKKGHE